MLLAARTAIRAGEEFIWGAVYNSTGLLQDYEDGDRVGGTEAMIMMEGRGAKRLGGADGGRDDGQ